MHMHCECMILTLLKNVKCHNMPKANELEICLNNSQTAGMRQMRFRLISDFSTTVLLFVPFNQYFNKFYWLRRNISLVILSIADTADNNQQWKPLCKNIIRIFARWICKIWMFSVLNEIDSYAFFIRITCIP